MESTAYTDDHTIANDACLWRRIPSLHFFFDENLGRNWPSKAAFEDDEDGHPMSVILTELVTTSGRGPAHVLHGHDGFALAQITADRARSKKQGVQRDPFLEEPDHALVFGNKTDSVKKTFAIRMHMDRPTTRLRSGSEFMSVSGTGFTFDETVNISFERQRRFNSNLRRSTATSRCGRSIRGIGCPP